MQDYQLRVIEEKRELDEKIAKLDQFMDGPIFKAIDLAEMQRLMDQYDAMGDYSEILGERIAAFK